MLLGCCHCGETPSDSFPPSESQSDSASDNPSSDDGPSYSETTSSCIQSFGCAAIPVRLTLSVPVSTGNWDGKPDCICQHYDGTFVLKFCGCVYEASVPRYVLTYATDDLGVYRGRVGFPSTDLIGCRTKASGPCTPSTSLSYSRKYALTVTSGGLRLAASTIWTAQDVFPFPQSSHTREWTFTGSINCLASASYTLTPLSYVSGLTGCGWGNATLSPG